MTRPIGPFTKAKACAVAMQEAELAAALFTAIGHAFSDVAKCHEAMRDAEVSAAFLADMQRMPDIFFDLAALHGRASCPARGESTDAPLGTCIASQGGIALVRIGGES